MRDGAELFLLRGRRPPVAAGLAAIAVLLILCTLLVYPLAQITRVTSLGVVYLLGVAVVSTFWGLWLGIVMSVLSAAAFNFFHIPPVGHFTIADSGNWVALATFLVVAVIISSVSELARARAREAMLRHAEADLTAEMAQLLLARSGIEEALALIGHRLADVFELSSVTLVRDGAEGDVRHEPITLMVADRRLGTLLIPAGVPARTRERIQTVVVPALSAVLSAAVEREHLVAEAVQTEGLRRSEAIKTAVLRAVSHDLRSPLTAMITAGAAVRAPDVSAPERDELGAVVQQEGSRLAKLIDGLLDLSRLEANAAAPELTECSIEEVVDSALALQPPNAEFIVEVEPDLPLVRADFVQVERAVANLLENATRYSSGQPVAIRARHLRDHVVVRVSDRGPGIATADQARIFEPFFRSVPSGGGDGHSGSGLGLAIARGFVETNGGRVWVESASGRGSVFVIELPVAGMSVAEAPA